MCYADDTQVYEVIKVPSKWSETADRISKCVTEMQEWMCRNMLKINPEKFEYIVFHPKRHTDTDFSISIGGISFAPSKCVKNLGVHQDEHLQMEKHISSVVRACYHQIRSIGRIRNYITIEACRTLVQTTVISRLDYANAFTYWSAKDPLV